MDSSSVEDLMDDCKVYYKDYKKDQHRFFKPFAVAVLVSIVLSVVCIVLAILYAQAHGPAPESTRFVKLEKKYKLCNDDNCFQLGKAIVHNLNQSADPCKDFYAYACGGWQKRNPLGKGEDISKVTSYLIQKIDAILKQGLEKVLQNYTTNVAVMKTVRFYKSCTNTTAIESSGIRPLIKLIDDYGGWSLFNNTDLSVSIETRIARAARELGVNSLIGAGVMTDKYNTSNTILYMQYAALTFPDTSYYFNKSKVVQNQVKKAIDDFLKMLGINGTSGAAAKLWRLYDFETKLAQVRQ